MTDDILKQNAPSQEEIENIEEKQRRAETSEEPDEPEEEVAEEDFDTQLFAVRTTANREDQVVDFLSSNIEQKSLAIHSIVRAHGMRGYIFVEAQDRATAERGIQGIPYAKNVLPKDVQFDEIEHLIEQATEERDIRKNDIAEIISGPFKRQEAKIIRIDKGKEEVVVELLEAAVPIPITLNTDAIKVIRRED